MGSSWLVVKSDCQDRECMTVCLLDLAAVYMYQQDILKRCMIHLFIVFIYVYFYKLKGKCHDISDPQLFLANNVLVLIC
jgi:hypothetical protein